VNAKIVLLPGDGIGPEIVAEARLALDAVARKFGHQFQYETHVIGGCAIDAHGTALPDATLSACMKSDAVLLGAVGGPKWDDPTAKVRPEQGLLKIRKEMQLFANLRPIKTWDCIVDSSPLRRDIVAGTDILFVRELTGGIYFGASGLEKLAEPGQEKAWNVMEYSTHEIERVVRVAAKAAQTRRGKLTSVDKANVLEVSRLWRRVTHKVIKEEFPNVTCDNVLVDAMAMHLVSRPRDFDVVVTENLFGDILTDEGSMLPGSLGLLPSASLGSDGPGLYEPIHGSAPDIAGKGIANPLATILAGAMLLRHSLKLEAEALAIEAAVQRVLDAGHRTKDIARGGTSINTRAMGQLVIDALSAG
jgi:3-isopropylmalate dehydrogenase